MKGKSIQKGPGLLSRTFKTVGLSVLILALLPVLIVKAAHVQLALGQTDLLRIVTLNLVILGLLFIAGSRDKIEDELTLAIRLKSALWTFLFGSFYVIIMPVVDLLFQEPVTMLTAQELIITMLLGFLAMYYLQKTSR